VRGSVKHDSLFESKRIDVLSRNRDVASIGQNILSRVS